MKREIKGENPNGEIIMRLYQLCSSYMDQAQALLDKNLKITKLDYKTYHFSYFDSEFEFEIYKKREDASKEDFWYVLAARKFLENYKMLEKFLEVGMEIVIGYVNSCQDGKKVLNSWIEEKINDTTYIKDINRNLIMKKEDYDNIFMPIEIMRKKKEKEEKPKVKIMVQ